jgi:hypothetical protein
MKQDGHSILGRMDIGLNVGATGIQSFDERLNGILIYARPMLG